MFCPLYANVSVAPRLWSMNHCWLTKCLLAGYSFFPAASAGLQALHCNEELEGKHRETERRGQHWLALLMAVAVWREREDTGATLSNQRRHWKRNIQESPEEGRGPGPPIIFCFLIPPAVPPLSFQ
ncbi:thyrotropin-releasing hormone receptor-like [Platysternon megacephalum]|uniref:Thyrotropin-releasing hormone receptor-like n=1 Tax=Platysternon megacephalum TaxID=55544 RepID=A0A4D9ECV3_9SAUR|nr:thyrotropin-releasing hormone receptor-like [Platysternon megacephalum]